MTRRLDELLLRRGRLLERIAAQRDGLAWEVQPLAQALDSTDRFLGRVRSGLAYLRQNPLVVTLAVTVLVATRGRRLWPWARRGLLAWRTWQTVRHHMAAFGFRAGL